MPSTTVNRTVNKKYTSAKEIVNRPSFSVMLMPLFIGVAGRSVECRHNNVFCCLYIGSAVSTVGLYEL